MVHDGADYLDAWCHSAEAPRLFRLDRIHEATVLDSPVETEPEPPRDLTDGALTGGDEGTLVTLSLTPEARWVVEYYDVREVRPGEDGWQVDLWVADERWLERLLLRLAPYARVVSPPGFAAGYDASVLAALALYDHHAG